MRRRHSDEEDNIDSPRAGGGAASQGGGREPTFHSAQQPHPFSRTPLDAVAQYAALLPLAVGASSSAQPSSHASVGALGSTASASGPFGRRAQSLLGLDVYSMLNRD